jgi:hypothetical protein
LLSGFENEAKAFRTPLSLASSLELPGAKNTARVDELTAGADGDGLAVGVAVGVGVAVRVGVGVVGAGVLFWFDDPLLPAPAARNVAVVLAD